jgi:hypothetical protein
MSLDVYAESERIVAALTDEQCDAVLAAIYERGHRWELTYRGTTWLATTSASTSPPARHKVGVLEAIRGVECCDPKTVRLWQVFRLWLAVVCVGVGVVLMLEPWHRAALLGVACVLSLAVGFSMLRGKASVCH